MVPAILPGHSSDSYRARRRDRSDGAGNSLARDPEELGKTQTNRTLDLARLDVRVGYWGLDLFSPISILPTAASQCARSTGFRDFLSLGGRRLYNDVRCVEGIQIPGGINSSW